MQIERIKNMIVDVPNFPKRGVGFKDLSTLFQKGLYDCSQAMRNLFIDVQYEFVAGIDARGFIVGTALAMNTGKQFVPIRKEGKLPPPFVRNIYKSEYGVGALEVKHADKNLPYSRVLIVDDVLATGGTFDAAGDLCREAGYEVVGFGAVVDLRFLNKFEYCGLKCRSLVPYEK